MRDAGAEILRGEIKERPLIPMATAIENTFQAFAPKDLPVFNRRNEVMDLVRGNDRIIIEAETGSGKSTVAPVIALAEAQARRGSEGRVIVTQPTRFAVDSLYKYLSESMGDKVGYRHGGDQEVTDDTRLEFAVEATLLNEMISGNDPLLMKYDTVMLDEVHMRTVNIDILMPLLKQAQAERKRIGRPLKVILTSATLNREQMMEYFDGAKHIKVEGRMFEVKRHFEKESTDLQDIPLCAAQKAAEIHTAGEEPGDMLIFMPGISEIDDTIRHLSKQPGFSETNVEFISLSGGEENKENRANVYLPSDKRRIFIATSVAETSVTIPSVRIVIDPGYMRLDVFNEDTGVTGRETMKHTQGNVTQREGRAGRVAKGHVHFLFSEEDLNTRDPHLKAEILRTNLVTQVFLMKQLGIKEIAEFDFLDHPGKEKINQALIALQNLGALSSDDSLTEIGKRMAKYKVEPRFARMIVEAEDNECVEEVALIASMMLLTKPIFDRKYKQGMPFKTKYSKYAAGDSDVTLLLKVWNDYLKNDKNKDTGRAWQNDNGIKTRQLYDAGRTRKEILKNKRLENREIELTPEKITQINLCVAAGLPENLVIKKNGKYQTVSGAGGINIDKNSVLADIQPAAFIAGSIRKNNKDPRPFAGFNIAIPKELASKMAVEFKKYEPSHKEQKEEELQPHPEQVTANTNAIQAALQSESHAYAVHHEEMYNEILGEPKEERFWYKMRERIRNFFRKLRRR